MPLFTMESRMKTHIPGLAIAAVLALHGLPAAAQSPEQAAAALRARSCQGCHGEKGDSTDPSVPRLNGQQLRYLQLRLDSFRYPALCHRIDRVYRTRSILVKRRITLSTKSHGNSVQNDPAPGVRPPG